MKRRERHNLINKSEWREGPWMEEPDRVDWVFEGMMCRAERQDNRGHLCGYIGVPPGHPTHGHGYDDDETNYIEIHGGVTFGNHFNAGDEDEQFAELLRHWEQEGFDTVSPGEIWWIGFDCTHAYDYSDMASGDDSLFGKAMAKAGYPIGDPNEHEVYRNINYVIAETEKLARQLRQGGENG